MAEQWIGLRAAQSIREWTVVVITSRQDTAGELAVAATIAGHHISICLCSTARVLVSTHLVMVSRIIDHEA